jgi:hypothetical protein
MGSVPAVCSSVIDRCAELLARCFGSLDRSAQDCSNAKPDEFFKLRSQRERSNCEPRNKTLMQLAAKIVPTDCFVWKFAD